MHDPEAIAALDQFYPPCGPCMVCGHTDKRHRLWDALMEALGPVEQIADEWDLPVEHVRAVRRVQPYRKGGRRMTPNAELSGGEAVRLSE
jgi:hypothetical protein